MTIELESCLYFNLQQSIIYEKPTLELFLATNWSDLLSRYCENIRVDDRVHSRMLRHTKIGCDVVWRIGELVTFVSPPVSRVEIMRLLSSSSIASTLSSLHDSRIRRRETINQLKVKICDSRTFVKNNYCSDVNNLRFPLIAIDQLSVEIDPSDEAIAALTNAENDSTDANLGISYRHTMSRYVTFVDDGTQVRVSLMATMNEYHEIDYSFGLEIEERASSDTVVRYTERHRKLALVFAAVALPIFAVCWPLGLSVERSRVPDRSTIDNCNRQIILTGYAFDGCGGKPPSYEKLYNHFAVVTATTITTATAATPSSRLCKLKFDGERSWAILSGDKFVTLEGEILCSIDDNCNLNGQFVYQLEILCRDENDGITRAQIVDVPLMLDYTRNYENVCVLDKSIAGAKHVHLSDQLHATTAHLVNNFDIWSTNVVPAIRRNWRVILNNIVPNYRLLSYFEKYKHHRFTTAGRSIVTMIQTTNGNDAAVSVQCNRYLSNVGSHSSRYMALNIETSNYFLNVIRLSANAGHICVSRALVYDDTETPPPFRDYLSLNGVCEHNVAKLIDGFLIATWSNGESCLNEDTYRYVKIKHCQTIEMYVSATGDLFSADGIFARTIKCRREIRSPLSLPKKWVSRQLLQLCRKIFDKSSLNTIIVYYDTPISRVTNGTDRWEVAEFAYVRPGVLRFVRTRRDKRAPDSARKIIDVIWPNRFLRIDEKKSSIMT